MTCLGSTGTIFMTATMILQDSVTNIFLLKNFATPARRRRASAFLVPLAPHQNAQLEWDKPILVGHLLRVRDSNPNFLLQRQTCYHYTNPQRSADKFGDFSK